MIGERVRRYHEWLARDSLGARQLNCWDWALTGSEILRGLPWDEPEWSRRVRGADNAMGMVALLRRPLMGLSLLRAGQPAPDWCETVPAPETGTFALAEVAGEWPVSLLPDPWRELEWFQSVQLARACAVPLGSLSRGLWIAELRG